MRHLLIDGNHVASRARHAQVASLRTAKGEPSGIVCGVLNSIHWACHVTQIPTTQAITFWDGGRASGRMALFPDYKKRKPPETEEERIELEDFIVQMRQASLGLSLLGSRQVRCDGTEADDLISIVCTELEAAGHDVVIFSGDKDMHQLVSSRVQVLGHNDERPVGQAEICQRWGVSDPAVIPELRAMLGDSSDNIPGIPGIGEKRALVLFPFRSLIFTEDDVSELPIAKLIAKAREHVHVLDRNYRLMRLPRSWSESFYGELQRATVSEQVASPPQRRLADFIAFCRRWEFASILDQITAW